jgi:hypothetical protein
MLPSDSLSIPRCGDSPSPASVATACSPVATVVALASEYAATLPASVRFCGLGLLCEYRCISSIKYFLKNRALQ